MFVPDFTLEIAKILMFEAKSKINNKRTWRSKMTSIPSIPWKQIDLLNDSENNRNEAKLVCSDFFLLFLSISSFDIYKCEDKEILQKLLQKRHLILKEVSYLSRFE